MQQVVKTLGRTQILYYTKGDSPTLLIHSGTHGDEYGVIDSVRLAVEKYEAQLPDFIYVPIVSPSAVAKRSRLNWGGLDLNRSFFGDNADSEVQANQEIVKGKSLDLLVTFHEDSGPGTKFYLYDMGLGLEDKDSWKKFRDEVGAMGVGLLSGTDDPDDPYLNYTFTEGYHYWSVPVKGYEGGSFDAWATRNKVVKKALIPEIPGHLSQDKKNKVVDLFFQKILLT
ncbi:hypothetical protein A3A84_01020 [Candidatus Collierbacteria bacterium RIFCSPLOWO2_01_FULL_50_23]|uniref:Succinylglutamate desuccinylase/Aspartoacylase catalytic domain-containing protein n=2 Tax=Candidatus Collieribacteriota TaxID=1752725 RepID=A0A1F5EQT7_9BACT|nr:MAG: hypothetical protein A3D09_01770 [Candidatus Collierbacteria bacterium RIFCSPHIGHO2_02_FULL_49_10]OGD71367.1 MAG: hypothetical protein A2703_03565 [Candidatus Collierbacteria bacterium RIFCSPHIGHO2_01_FULL_50_25]OGD74034.1 MAG: hypothetical protein A3A84_01020 [Candidatus Collierbacteria bacterium RIFCSPLOWO2_01_FULL_50_23]